ncbi:2Fe-2S iron-sulfur cluster-binding protein [Achromobacter aegrifaciens]|uniref:Phenol hydroxylase P5 protein n=1 Tax=Achromobacter aegrifaciens TaxID=1287736 RepID=A0AAD2QE72_ACHAE|nr:2Fe-2S iron-sulfur cluster binding domain-containing protein [Achromobacter aegrifaciens]CUJ68930.1 Phenol hydroxylase P5 protein [Achromobacter aegrifaciens]
MKLKIQARNGSHVLDGRPDQSILIAALGSGLDLPYACATGTCGTCKARVLSGKSTDKWPDAPGKSKLNAATNEILLCQCIPQGDCEIEVSDFVYRSDIGALYPVTLDGVVSRWEIVAPDIALWTVELAQPIDFNAGQFALVSFHGTEGARAYSMVNFARNTKELTFVTKKKPGGKLTSALFSGNPLGKSVEVMGPLGRAVFTPSMKRNILCIAGGSGIAGMMSILDRASQERYFEQFKGYWFFGVRSMRDAFFLRELTEFKRHNGKNLEIVVGLSEGAASGEDCADYPELVFDTGLIHEVAAKHMEGRYRNLQAYLAGPTPLVDAAIRNLVIGAKFDAKNIAYDKFS